MAKKLKLNVKLLRKVQKFLLAEPRRFDMADWIVDSQNSEVLKQPPCGTALCIAGAAYAIEKKLKMSHTTIKQEKVQRFAVKALGAGNYAWKLFLVGHWPDEFAREYMRSKTPLARVKVGVARIEHFIKTNGEE